MLTPFLMRWRASLEKEETLLLFVSFCLVLTFLTLGLMGIFPFKGVDFAFFSLMVFLSALYRPAWMFLLLIALLPLETTILAPPALGIGLHPYQWWGTLLFLAILVRILGKRMPFPPFQFSFRDVFIVLLLVGAGASALLNASPDSLRLVSILGSFVLLYFLGRIFFRSARDVFTAFPFFFGSALVCTLFGLLQNILFLSGQPSFSVMPGRPNGTLSEADWLGMFLLIFLSAILTSFWYLRQGKETPSEKLFEIKRFSLLAGTLLLVSVVLILTVSRSAWVAAAVLFFSFVLLSMLERKDGQTTLLWKEGIFESNLIVVVLVLSLFIVKDFGLTRFELLNRAASTGTGLQRITIACEEKRALPESITTLDELIPLHCRFIALEAREEELHQRKYVTTLLRPDPNITLRQNIYGVVGEALSEHPLLGIGWGSIGERLGQDSRGATLNASNVYLEIWLGAGLLGFVAFLLFLFFAFSRSLGIFLEESSREKKSVALFFFLSLLAISVFNLFNSGILLGFIWLLFSLAPLFDEKKTHANHSH